jgi:hypothetical protein
MDQLVLEFFIQNECGWYEPVVQSYTFSHAGSMSGARGVRRRAGEEETGIRCELSLLSPVSCELSGVNPQSLTIMTKPLDTLTAKTC